MGHSACVWGYVGFVGGGVGGSGVFLWGCGMELRAGYGFLGTFCGRVLVVWTIFCILLCYICQIPLRICYVFLLLGFFTGKIVGCNAKIVLGRICGS